MKKLCLLFFVLLATEQMHAQDKYFTREGSVSFYSHAIIEDIKAVNNDVLSVVDVTTGKIAIQITMRSFVFEKGLMQEHFNENYVESYKYPKATFFGKILHIENLSNENIETEVVGKITLHGKEKELRTTVAIKKDADEIIVKGVFDLTLADFEIKIPKIVFKNIAEQVAISFELHHKPYIP